MLLSFYYFPINIPAVYPSLPLIFTLILSPTLPRLTSPVLTSPHLSPPLLSPNPHHTLPSTHLLSPHPPIPLHLFSPFTAPQDIDHPMVYAALIPIIGGVGLASLKELSFTWTALIAASLANQAAAFKNVVSKVSTCIHLIILSSYLWICLLTYSSINAFSDFFSHKPPSLSYTIPLTSPSSLPLSLPSCLIPSFIPSFLTTPTLFPPLSPIGCDGQTTILLLPLSQILPTTSYLSFPSSLLPLQPFFPSLFTP